MFLRESIDFAVFFVTFISCSVMVLKKLGPELMGEFLQVVRYLGEERNIKVLVEKQDFEIMVRWLF